MREQVLLLDADQKSTALLSRSVHPSYETVVIGNLDQALEFLESSSSVEGVILDPRTVTGDCCAEFVRVVLDEDGWATLPFVILSREIDLSAVAYYWSLGVDECLTKPFDPGRVWGVMYNLISVNHYSITEEH